jgi:multidrug efflux pump subunit AcrB
VTDDAPPQVGGHDRAAEERARDDAIVRSEKNTARFFTEHRHVAWVALLFTIVWGVLGYLRMPKKKDPTFDPPVAVVTCVWPGARADQIEDLITRKIEQKLAESTRVDRVESTSRTSTSIVYVFLKEDVADRAKEWTDLEARVGTIRDLPQGAESIVFHKDFGDTTTLMLTVASPEVNDVELDLRAEALRRAIDAARVGASGARATIAVGFAPDVDPRAMMSLGGEAKHHFEALASTRDARVFQGPGFFGLDVATSLDDEALRAELRRFVEEHLRFSELHPDLWKPAIVRDPASTRARLKDVAGARYTHHELDLFTDLLQRRLQALPIVSRVTRTGVIPEQIQLEYAQSKVAGYGLDPSAISKILAARNVTASGGILEVAGKTVAIDPSGAFRSEREIGDVLVASVGGAPVYLRDVVDVRREYQSPSHFYHSLSVPGEGGKLVERRAITLAVTMTQGAQIAEFGRAVDAELASTKRLLPDDLVVVRTSDQPLQVRENVDLFMRSLLEAIVIIVLVALVGFFEWRSAVLLALSIPITLAMTFGLMSLFGVEVQQISIASLIIALGLLIDDPVVASDAIKGSLARGYPARVAAWLGPTKLATAIVYATITNIVAYLPFLLLTGDVGKFMWSLPVVLTLSLVASRVVSMTFVPLLGASLLRPPKTPSAGASARRRAGFGRVYARAVELAIDHRWLVLAASLAVLAGGAFAGRSLKQAFFPKDRSYLSYVDVWLPEDQPLSATREKAAEVQREIAAACAELEAERPGKARGGRLLTSLTTFVGAGGPRFWFSVQPELPQQNYAQIVIQLGDKEETNALVPFLQSRLAKRIAGARVDVRQLESGKPVGIPVSLRIRGDDIETLRSIAERTKRALRETEGLERPRDDWGADTFAVKLAVDPDRANLAGVTNLDVALSSATAMNGAVVGQMRDGERQIDLVLRMRPQDRVDLGDVDDLYVYAQGTGRRVPLGQVSKTVYATQTEKIRRRNHTRTIVVSAFPSPGLLPSEALARAMPKIEAIRRSLPPGYALEIGGEHEEQVRNQKEMAVIAAVMLLAMYAALVVQFRHAIKPLIVFLALPYGVAAALVSLYVTRAPLGFMAALGIISLMGVIVSHVIVLFDFIEEQMAHGVLMREALVDAGRMRLRPVLVTVVATVLGLVPLAEHGGPLWEPLCYAQIGGLTFATVITLVLVPVLYTIFVKDLRLVRWAAEEPAEK